MKTFQQFFGEAIFRNIMGGKTSLIFWAIAIIQTKKNLNSHSFFNEDIYLQSMLDSFPVCRCIFRIQEHLKYRLQYKSYESCIPKNAYSCNNLKTANYVPFTYACLKRASENEAWINSYLAEQIVGKFTQPFTFSRWLSILSWWKSMLSSPKPLLEGFPD